MSTQPNITGKKTYCVWADSTRRMYQHVEAENPEQARRIAESQPECWDDGNLCEDRDAYRVSAEGQDLETEDSARVDNPVHCKSCGSEIVTTVNDSNFREGECGPCEYRRYQTHPRFVEAAFATYGALCDLSYHPCFRWRRARFREANESIEKLAPVLNEYGGEA
jgi:hypothetical protein